MNRRYALGVLVFLGSLGIVWGQVSSNPRPGLPGAWRMLGTVQADFGVDHDIIRVNGPYDYFRRIKIKVTNAPLNLMRMVVRYDDGGLPEKIEVRRFIPQGGESRIVDLRGGSRKLRSVEFWYDTQGVMRGRALLTLFGQK